MWLQRTTNYLLARTSFVLTLVFALSFVPVIGVLGILYAALVTLRKGLVEGALMTFAATLPFLVTFVLTKPNDALIPPLLVWAAVGVAVSSNILTYVFAAMLERKATWSVILQVAALLGVLVVSVLHLLYPDIVSWWQDGLQGVIKFSQGVTPVSGDVLTEQQLQAIQQTKYFATGLMTVGVIFNALVQLVAARWWEVLVFRPGHLQKELHNIRLSKITGVLFIATIAITYIGNTAVIDMLPVIYTLFFVAGMSLVHALFKRMQSPTRWFWLMLLYVGIMLTIPVSVMMVSFLALADIWLDFRKRLITQ